MKKLFMIAAIALLAVACNKDQAAVKKLDGTWKVTSMKSTSALLGEIELLGTFFTSVQIVFDGCKLKTDEFCTVTTTTVASALFGGETDVESDLFRVTNDGETIEMKDDASSVTINTMTINELTKTTCKFTQTEGTGEELSTTVVTLEKQ
jgi:hypothetical protein